MRPRQLGFPNAARACIRKRKLIGREPRRVSRVCWQEKTLVLRFFQHGAASFLAVWIAVTLGCSGVFFLYFYSHFSGAQCFTEPKTMRGMCVFLSTRDRDMRRQGGGYWTARVPGRAPSTYGAGPRGGGQPKEGFPTSGHPPEAILMRVSARVEPRNAA